MRNQKLQNNNNWKGDEASYKGVHQWINRTFGKASKFPCNFCKIKSNTLKMNWANLSHEYTRDRNDWVPACKKCHSKYDQEHFRVYSYPKSELHKKHISESSKGVSKNKGKNNPMYGKIPWNKKLENLNKN